MTRRRELAELTAGLAVLAAIWLLVRVLVSHVVIAAFFATPTARAPSGGAVWSNLVASAVCVGVVWWRLRVKMIAHHVEQLAQARRHHDERMAQADVHHRAVLEHVTKAVNGGQAGRRPVLTDPGKRRRM